MLRPALAALLVAALMAGCTGPAADPADDRTRPTESVTGAPAPTQAPATSPAPRQERMDIRGVVLDGALRPLPDAEVLLQELDQAQKVGPAGTFEFLGLVPSTYFITASAPEHRPQTLSVDPSTAGETLRFTLESLPTNQAFNETVHFTGHLQCALEVLIISPSCDSLLTDPRVGGPAVFNSTSTVFLPVKENWRTIVVDVVFKPEDQPLLDGLRVTVRGTFSPDSLGTYDQYGRFKAPEPFTFRLEPGGVYEDGIGPVPANATQFQFDVYPHSKAYHAVCIPPETCFLGAGFGLDVAFDLYMTTFYVDPAPEGWTLRE